MATNPDYCAACGSYSQTHEHHLLPRVHRGKNAPTVFLCMPCHSAVHRRYFSNDHRELTIAGLARARAEGRIGGNKTNPAFAGTQANAVNQARANAFARDIMPVLAEIEATGRGSSHAVAMALNSREITTRNGMLWCAKGVQRLRKRIAAIKTEATQVPATR